MNGGPLCLPCAPYFQAASGPRVLCIPQIILTECTSGSPSLPESSLEELGPKTVPTPRPRTLAGSRRACHDPRALLGLAAEVLWPRSSSLSRKEQSILPSPHNAEAGVLCPWGPSLDETQKPFTAETHSEETPQNSECDSQACNRGHQAIVSGHPVQDATPLRMDSLEETLQELEATLREMGANTTMTSPSSPQSPPSSPQVAASPFSPAAFLLQSLGLQSGEGGATEARLPFIIPTVFVSAYLPLGVLFPGQGLWAEPGAAGKPAHPGLSSAVWA